MPTDDDSPKMPRRHLLGAGAAGLASLALAEGCSSSSDNPCGGAVHCEPPLDAGPGDAPGEASAGETGGECGGSCTQNTNTLVIPLASTPALNKSGGSTTVTDSRFQDTFCLQNSVIVVQPEAGKFLAFSASCTHNCCTVAFTGQGFHCPCHNSTYDLKGQVTGGPAGTPLQELPTCADGCNVYVRLK